MKKQNSPGDFNRKKEEGVNPFHNQGTPTQPDSAEGNLKSCSPKNKGSVSVNQSVSKFTYLLSSPFPVEKITLGKIKYEVLELLYYRGNPHSISRSLKKGRSTIIQHLEELEKKGLAYKPEKDGKKIFGLRWQITDKGRFLIEKSVGFPVKSSRVASRQSAKTDTYPPNYNRGHALQFRIELPSKLTNEAREKLLRAAEIEFKSINIFGGGQGFVFMDKKVHLTSSSIIIYDSEDHFAIDAEKSEDNATIKTLYFIRNIERELNLLLSIDKHYKIKITKRHHALIKNALAEIYNKSKEKRLEVFAEDGLWLLIDNSWNLNELECVHSVTGKKDADGMQEIMNSFRRTDFKATSEFVLETFENLKRNEEEIIATIKKGSEREIMLTQWISQLENNFAHLTKFVYQGRGK